MNGVSTSTHPFRPGWTLALVSVAAFLTSLDVMVVVTALPTIQEELNASLADLEWTVNAYNLAFACLMLIGSALGDRFGRLKIYVLGLSVFTLASGMAALAPSVEVLILARVLQGIAAGVAIPVSLTLLGDAYPPHKRGRAMGIWGSVSGAAVAAGPVAGGLITEGLSWQWIFWLNVPLGVAATILAVALMRESFGARSKMDIVGLGLASLGLFGLVWAAVRAPGLGWGHVEVVVMALGGVAMMVGFVSWERQAEHPVLPLRYFRARGFTISNASAFFMHFSLIGSLFIISQMFQIGMGANALEAGLRILAWTAMVLVVAPIAGRFSDRFGARPFIVGGLALMAAGLTWLGAVVGTDTGYLILLAPLAFGGIGIAMSLPSTINLALSSVPMEDMGVASGANNAMRELGGVFGVAFLGAMFAANGGYATPAAAIDGFQAALYLGGAMALVGMVIALFAPGRPPADVSAPAAPELKGAKTGG
ncbi:EmrB/QacA subfamily drug resistance transporter [Nonomuraea fuscirosea]|uniref:EmrB/QacA subfamily drug resistance transporter n=1 Tax=Nonomuraea fuscirosea TaxID=1291556 RepID=A0A2T0M1W8_9ACTN|nr:MFS transporter [Nonomuraea fuscirosea]PRX50722.1 EmrB/QacA subfamily drug resistance transporter [Nonomuraea fuscirosea]